MAVILVTIIINLVFILDTTHKLFQAGHRSNGLLGKLRAPQTLRTALVHRTDDQLSELSQNAEVGQADMQTGGTGVLQEKKRTSQRNLAFLKNINGIIWSHARA